jgi:uncharacterized protein YoaH (UPF0181 family)
MDTQQQPQKEVSKRLVTSIEAYRAARAAGKTRIIPMTDSYGQVAISVEQDVKDMYTHEDSINVLPNIRPEQIKSAVEEVKKLMNEGTPNDQSQTGVEQHLKNAENMRKQAEHFEKQAEERRKLFSDRIADMEALYDDALESEKQAQAEYERKIAASTAAVERKVKEEKLQAK